MSTPFLDKKSDISEKQEERKNSCAPGVNTLSSLLMDSKIEKTKREFATLIRAQEMNDGSLFDVSRTVSGLDRKTRMRVSSVIMDDLLDIPKSALNRDPEQRLCYLIGKVIEKKRDVEENGQPFTSEFTARMPLEVGTESPVFAGYDMVVLIKHDKEGQYLEVHKAGEKVIATRQKSQGKHTLSNH